MTNGSLMKVESIAECSPWSILQWFWPSFSKNRSWKQIFSLFESGRFTQVLLYVYARSDGSGQTAAGQFDKHQILALWLKTVYICKPANRESLSISLHHF